MVIHSGHYTGSLSRRVDPKTLVQGKYDWMIMRDGTNHLVAKGEADHYEDAWRDMNVIIGKMAEKDLEVETKLRQQHRLYQTAAEKIAS